MIKNLLFDRVKRNNIYGSVITAIVIILISYLSMEQVQGQNCTVNAGVDQSVCVNSTMTLNGVSNGLFQGSGNITWSQVAGPSVTIVSPHSLTTNVTGFTAGSVYSFILSAKCLDGSLVTDLVNYTVKPITTANAGPDQTLCPGSGTLAANAPAVGETGLWSIVSGSGISVTTPSSPTSAITLSPNGSSNVTLRWTITGPAGSPQCISQDDIIITNPGGVMPVTAGSNQILSNCYSSTTSTSLAGSYGGSGTNGQHGTWTVINGPNVPTFGNVNQSNTSVSNLIQGTYTLQWTVSGPCANGSATMTITVPAPTSNVTGATASSLSFCDGRTSFVLTGNDPLYAGETVHWTQTAGLPATIVSPNTPITSVTVPSGSGSYSFLYTISNLSTGCSTSATANVTYNIAPSITITAGSFMDLPCNDSTASVAYTESGSGTVQYSILSGPTNWFYSSFPTAYQNATASPQVISHLSKAGTYVIRFRKTPGVGSSCLTVSADISIVVSLPPSLSNAGTSQLLACNIFSTALAGNIPTVGTGTWSQVSGPNAAVIANPNLNNTSVSGFINGVYKFRWLISAGPMCPTTQSDVRVIVASIVPTAANAGPDQTVCYATPLTLQGNTPILNEVGTWTVVPAYPTFSDIHNPHAVVSGLLASTVYTFTWTITNACGTTTDFAIITTSSTVGPVQSNAGPDQCLISGTTTMTMAGNSPAPGTGLWTRLTGPNSPTITTPSLNTTTVTGMVNGTYTFEWAITSGSCAVSRDTMMVTISLPATLANAGGNQNVCGTSVILTGNTPVVGTGLWTQEVGNAGATIVSPTSPTTSVTGLFDGVYVFRWTISNNACPSNYSEATIYVSTPPSAAVAGPNQTLCGATFTNMAATPVVIGTGTWLMLSGPNTPVIANYTSPTTLVSGMITGTYNFRWTVSSGPTCPVNTSDVTITVYESANAGLDQTYCDATTVNLAGNVASTGTWTQVGVTPNVATITTTGSNTATASGLITGIYTFQYTITGAGGCSGSSDVMTVTISGQPAPAGAGPDQDLCGNVSFTFNATPNPVPGGQTGTWTKIFGPAGGSFSDSHSPTATFTGAVPGLYVFVWTISEGGCSNGDQVRITNNAPPTTSDAGPAQDVCGTVATMAANTPVNGTGNWTQISGPNTASITSVILPNTTITGLIDGTYVFRWTISNPPCPSSSSDVTINDHTAPTAADAGPDQSLCNVISTALAGNVITTGSGLWTQTSGPAATITTPTANNSTVTGLTAPGVYQFTWTSTIAWTYGIGSCTTSDVVQITNNPLPSTANAGPDQSVCLYSPVTLAATAPVVGAGTWTQTAGPTTVTFTDIHSPTTAVNGVDQGIYTFRWTVVNDGCPASFDDVIVTMNPNPTIAIAGPNQILCNNNTATMAANTPDPGHGTGTWSQISGPVLASITLPNSPTTTITGITTAGVYVFQWEIATGPLCVSDDQLQITRYSDVIITGPSNATICNGGTQLLTVSPSGGTGPFTYQWQQSADGSTGWGNVVGGSGALTNSYTTAVLASDLYYRCIVTCNCGTATSSVAHVTVVPDPNISVNPVGSTICSGTTWAMSVTASGGTPLLNYQWQYNTTGCGGAWTNVGGNSPNYTTAALTQTTYYHVLVSATGNGCNTATSACATVFVPVITTQPVATTNICNGGSVTLTTAAAGGTATFTYQWESSPTGLAPWTPIPGEIAASYTTPVLPTGEYYYHCVIGVHTPACADLVTSAAHVHVVKDPVIDIQPSSPADICAGGTTANMIVTASGGTPSLTYQWQYFNGVTWNNVVNLTPAGAVYTGGTLNTFHVAGISAAGGYQYRCLVSSAGLNCDQTTSNTVIVTVIPDPSLTPPLFSNTAICVGGTTVVSSTISGGTGVPTYQWQYWNGAVWNSVANNTPAGATYTNFNTNAMTISGTTATGSFQYRLTTNNASGCDFSSAGSSYTVIADPAITVQPAGSNICVGGFATMSVTATGGTPILVYQWQSAPALGGPYTDVVGGVGGSTASYTTPVLATTTYYHVVISAAGDGCNTATSNNITVTVISDPIINTQPLGNTICNGGTHTMTVSASGGTPTLHYQWQYSLSNSPYSWVNIGADLNTYTTVALSATTYYQVIVTATGSDCNTTISNQVTVTVVPDPTIDSQPTDATICSGTTTTLTVLTHGGTPSLVYQWQYSLSNSPYNWINVSGGSGGNTNAYTTAALSATTYFHVLISATGSGCDPVTSNPVAVHIPHITTQPVSATICDGGTQLLSVAAGSDGGTATYTYQWQVSAIDCSIGFFDIPGATGTTYTTPALTGNRFYQCVISVLTPTCTLVTNCASVTVVPDPYITGQPSGGNICSGSTFTMSVTANGGTPALNYQWQSASALAGPYSNVVGGVGANSATYTTPALATTTYYQVIISASGNGCGTATSVPVTVTVSLSPTANAGGNNTICSTGTYSIAGSLATNYTSLLWTTSGTGTFNNPTAIHPIYTPSAVDIIAGSVTPLP